MAKELQALPRYLLGAVEEDLRSKMVFLGHTATERLGDAYQPLG